MLPRNFSKKLIIFLVGLIVVVVASSYYISKQYNSQSKTSQESSTSRAFPTEIFSQLSSNYKVLYKDSGDYTGRTFLYEKEGFPYNGSGLFYDNSSPPNLLLAIGRFKSWETIAGSKDRLLLLDDPINKRPIPKFRISFEDKDNPTSLEVENLSSGKLQNTNKLIRDIPDVKLNDMIKAGDALMVYPLSYNGNNTETDDKGYIRVLTLFVRREQGLKMVKL